MWYVLAQQIEGTISWWGAYEKEEDADRVAELVGGVAIKVKDWKLFSEIMDSVFDPLTAKNPQ